MLTDTKEIHMVPLGYVYVVQRHIFMLAKACRHSDPHDHSRCEC